MKRIYFFCLFLCLTTLAARPAQAQTEALPETVLYNFCSQPSCTDGANPSSSLTSDGQGNFYGTTTFGGTQQGYGVVGTVFELSPNGSGGWNETVLYSFCSAAGCPDGANPTYSYVIFDNAGNLYGTTYSGGAYGYGVVFELSPAGPPWTEKVLYSFCSQSGCSDGFNPINGLLFDASGNLYGTTNGGVFELSPEPAGGCPSGSNTGNGWCESVLYSASIPYSGLTMDAAGNIFGTTTFTAFELSPNGSGGWKSAVIYNFTNSTKDGAYADGTLVLDQAGNLYGTTYEGGEENLGAVYRLSPVTTGKKKGTWTEKLLHSFKGGTKDGSYPFAGIAFDASGNIYSTTTLGGKYDDGTVFELVAPAYTEKVVWSFDGADGGYGGYPSPLSSNGSLILDSSGHFYGTTNAGGSNGGGTVFEFNPSGKATTTTTTLTSSLNPSTSGEAVTFTAVVTPAPFDGETIKFEHGTTVLGTGLLSGGSASFTTSTLAVGTTTVKAVYGGDGDFDASTSNTVKQVVKE